MNALFESFNTNITTDQFIQGIIDTLYMIGWSLLIGTIIGGILGIILVVTTRNGIKPLPFVYKVVEPIINVVRSIPYIILITSLIPFSRFVVGSGIGSRSALISLVIFISPLIARLVENSLLEVGPGIIEAAESMGATPMQVIWHFLLPEAMGSIILSITTATISLIGATAIAGAVGAGGVGDIAIVYGYQRYDGFAMVSTIITLIIMVQILQTIGNQLARYFRRR